MFLNASLIQIYFDNLKTIWSTGESLSEALIFLSTNPQYDDRLFIELRVHCSVHENVKLRTRKGCLHKLFWMSETIFVHNMYSPGLSLDLSCIELVIQWTICRNIVG